MLQLRNESPKIKQTLPSFPPKLTVEFEKGFHIENGFYDQVKLAAQVHILSSEEFTKLAETHKIHISAPQFRYQIDKTGLMDEVPYPTNEFFRRNCKDPFMETRKGEKPKTHMELSFHCAISPLPKEHPKCIHEEEAMNKLRQLVEEYSTTPVHLITQKLSNLLHNLVTAKKLPQIKKKPPASTATSAPIPLASIQTGITPAMVKPVYQDGGYFTTNYRQQLQRKYTGPKNPVHWQQRRN